MNTVGIVVVILILLLIWYYYSNGENVVDTVIPQEKPTNGFRVGSSLVQWGELDMKVDSTAIVDLPQAYHNANSFVVLATGQELTPGPGSPQGSVAAKVHSANKIQLSNDSLTQRVTWLTLGY